MKDEHYDDLIQEAAIEAAGGYDEINPSSELDYYHDNKDDIIAQFRKEIDTEQLPEDDDTLESWYKPALLNIAKDWMESEWEMEETYIQSQKIFVFTT